MLWGYFLTIIDKVLERNLLTILYTGLRIRGMNFYR